MPTRKIVLLLIPWAFSLAFFFPLISVSYASENVVVALSSPVPTLDPRGRRVRSAMIVNWHIFDPLLLRDWKTRELKPWLATSVKNIAPHKWEIELRKGVRFHNGEPFNANSVKYTIESTLDPKNQFHTRTNFLWIKKVIIKDSHRLQIITHRPFPLLKEYLTTLFPVPPKYAEYAKEQMAMFPAGTGPYRHKGWEKGKTLVLEWNKKYWAGKPIIKKIAFRYISDPMARVAALLRGEVDVIRHVPVKEIGMIWASQNATVFSNLTMRVVYLQMDSMARNSNSHKALQNTLVRKAIAHAINVPAIIKNQLRGLSKRTATGISPLAFGYDPLAKPIRFDPVRARSLLTKAGFPNGITLTLNSYSGTILNVHQVAKAIQADLRKVGIQTNRRHFKSIKAYFDALRNGRMADLILGSWGSNSIFDSHQILHAILRGGAPFSYTNFRSLNDQISIGARSIDRNRRRSAYHRAQEIILNLIPWVPLYAQPEIIGTNRKLNLYPSGDEIIRLYGANWRK